MRAYYPALAALMAAVVLPASLTAQSATPGLATKADQVQLRSVQPVLSVKTPLTEQRGGGPPNDACTGAVAQNLAVGGTVTMSGNNTGATVDINAGGVDYTFVWEAFTLTECATVTVNYCVAGSVFTNFMINLTTSCPDILPGLIQTADYDDCTVTFANLAAGTWLIPVLVDPASTPAGNYTIQASAVACTPAEPYCTNLFNITEDIEPICRVQFAGIDNTSCSAVDCGPALEDFTNLAPAEVTAGQSYAMTVTGNTAGNYANYITAFVDWDQDGTFEASYQIGTFTNTVCQLNATGQIAVPANALAGTARMRIVKDYAAAVAYPADPCGVYDYGQAEDYMVNVTNNGGGGTPPNDVCTGAVAQNLAVGGSVTMSGNNTGATVDINAGGVDYTFVWEAFTITECATVTVNYCVPGSIFTNFMINLTTSCPDILPGLIQAPQGSFDDCTVTFANLAAGTWLIPVLVDPASTPVGDYTIEVSAVACTPAEPYCTNLFNITEDIEPICRVQFAGIDNTSCSAVDCGPALEDFTNLAPAEVTAGQSYAMTVTGNTAGNYANYITAFVDWDQDGTFEASYQIGTFTNTVCQLNATGQIAVPANALAGTARMRIIKDYAAAVAYPADPCGVYDYGQAEDYMVNVTNNGGGEPANDDCANATEIGDGTHAFSSENATGTDITSCTFGDSNDIWFEYVATCNGIATASTCNDANFDTSLSAWTGCGGTQIVCNDDADGCDVTSTITFAVVAGSSYWIRVAGYDGETGTGNLTVGCDGSISVPENDDCANATEISDGVHTFSSEHATGTDITSCTSGDTNDIWFEYQATCTGQVTASTCSDADFDTALSVWTACGGSEITCNDDDANCDGNTSTVIFMATNGTSYWIRVAGYDGATGTGNLTVSCDGSVTSPENDNCGDVTAVALAAGASVNFTGTTIGASNVGDFEAGSELEGEAPTVWHAFTLAECANVTISYCGTTPDFGNVWIFLSPDCPAGDDYILATNYNFTTCGDGNATMNYTGLAAGTYYLPVMFDAADANGPYTIEVAAVACPPVEPYCTNVLNFSNNVEPICSVEFAGIVNASCNTLNCGPALEDFTNLAPAQVITGESYTLSVTGNTDGNYSTFLTVFFDWDQDGTFETSQQIGSIVNSVCDPAISTSIEIPETAAEGTTRMRIIKDWAPTASPVYPSDPCGTYDYGQAEDYLVNVTISIGVDETAGAAWSVFPNPGNGDFTIRSGNVDGQVQVEVLDMTGRLVSAEQRYMVRGEQTAFNMAGRLAAGTYVLRLTSEAGRHEQRIVVR